MAARPGLPRLSAFEKRLLASIEGSPTASIVTTPRLPDQPIIGVNDAFCRLTGYTASECLGRNCRFLSGPGTESQARLRLARAIVAGRASVTELLNYRKDGSAFRDAVMIAPIREPDAEAVYFVGSQVDVSDDHHAGIDRRQAHAEALVSQLTVRQAQVLDRMIRGMRNKQIARELGIEEKTVKMHRAALRERLGAHCTADALRIGIESGAFADGR